MGKKKTDSKGCQFQQVDRVDTAFPSKRHYFAVLSGVWRTQLLQWHAHELCHRSVEQQASSCYLALVMKSMQKGYEEKETFYNGAIKDKSSRNSKLVWSRVLSMWDLWLQGLTTDELFYKVIRLCLSTVTFLKPMLLPPFGLLRCGSHWAQNTGEQGTWCFELFDMCVVHYGLLT